MTVRVPGRMAGGAAPLPRSVPAWLRPTALQAFRFGVVGAAAAASHTVLLLLLVEAAGVGPVPANGLAFLGAVCVSWAGQSLWVFRNAPRPRGRLPRFLLTVVAGFLANLLLMWLAVDVAGAPWPVGLALVLLLVPPATFLLAKFWVFERKPGP